MGFSHLFHIWKFMYSCQVPEAMKKSFVFLKHDNQSEPLRLAKTQSQSCQQVQPGSTGARKYSKTLVGNGWAGVWGTKAKGQNHSSFWRTKGALAGLGKQAQLLFPFRLSRNQKPILGTRTEFKIILQRFNFIPIQQHQHELDLQTLKQSITQDRDTCVTNF